MNLMNQTPIFTPASLLTCYNSALKVAVEAYPITVQGIYRPDRMNKLYGGVFYDRLIQESGKEELVIKVRPAQREQLSGKAEKLITIYGFVNRKVRPDSVIGVSLDLESVLNVEESKVSEDEKQFWNLQREKAQSGKKDVSLLFKNRLFSNEKPRVALLWATSSCTRTEFNNAAGNAAQSIEFVQLDTTFANIAQTVRTLKEVDGKYDAVALVRGGGSGLEVFNNNDLLGTIVRMKSAVISAVGHAEEKHNLKLLADLVIDTPTGLGKFFSDITESVTSEKAKSKAALVAEVRKQFAEQIETQNKTNAKLQEQLKAATEAQKKADEQHAIQVKGLQNQLEQISKSNQVKDKTNQEQVKNLTDQIAKLNSTHKEQTEAANKQIQELQKQLGEANEKSAIQMGKLSQGFQAQQKSFTEQVASLQRDAELRLKEISTKNIEIENLRANQSKGVSTTMLAVACARFHSHRIYSFLSVLIGHTVFERYYFLFKSGLKGFPKLGKVF